MQGRWTPRFGMHTCMAVLVTRFCWLRHVPASINSGATNIGATFSSKSSASCSRKDNYVAKTQDRLDSLRHGAGDGLDGAVDSLQRVVGDGRDGSQFAMVLRDAPGAVGAGVGGHHDGAQED